MGLLTVILAESDDDSRLAEHNCKPMTNMIMVREIMSFGQRGQTIFVNWQWLHALYFSHCSLEQKENLLKYW